MTGHAASAATAERLAASLAVPKPPPPDRPWVRQCLATGTAGIALLHIERLGQGTATRREAHAWISEAATGDIQADDSASLFLGAPAVTFMLHATGTYLDALGTMDKHLTELAHRRAAAAFDRIAAGQPSTFAEYDVFLGLAGLAALLLRRDPHGSATGRVLDYLVALTRPLRLGDTQVPGWWVGHDPHRRHHPDYAGHANFGAAHGITGPLAALALAAREGITVDGHFEAIETILHWLDQWRQDGPSAHWWPETITIAELHDQKPQQAAPTRPAWCYGTPGITRAGQLAAAATGDRARQRLFEQALLDALTDPAQLDLITDSGLCHGWAGVYQTAWRTAADTDDHALAGILAGLADRLVANAADDADEPGLLEGRAGTALALNTAARDAAPTSGWDACLLIS